MMGKFAQLFPTIYIIIFLLGTEEKPKRGIVISPPQLSLVLTWIHKGFNPVNTRHCLAVVDSKPTDVIVSLYLLSIGNFKVRQMVSIYGTDLIIAPCF